MAVRRTEIERLLWYAAGLFLFFAPFAFYQRLLTWLTGSGQSAVIHTMCLRRPLLYIVQGDFSHIVTISTISFFIILAVTLLAGPVFCGRLCATGAIPEYLSRIFPRRWQIDWTKTIQPVPVRYGFLVGFLASPFFAGTIAHAYCNFALTERLIDVVLFGRGTWLLGSTTVLTMLLWLVLLGAMATGGRGFCNYLCPVGAMQSLAYWLGNKLGLNKRIEINRAKCSRCRSCADCCPMRAWQVGEDGLTHSLHHCIVCHRCVQTCATGALSFVRRKDVCERDEV